ncbi:S8 family serine peptidase [Nonomuraea sp. NPDC004580]|uniref:S8 family serine peptidase n=1 Tax=Nonomuraea sp. NPDC004580 TaxID=3154552 RepID=UPI0033A7F37B
MIGSSNGELLAKLAHELASDPEVRLLRKLGDGDAPSLLVVEMSPEHAVTLNERLAPQVTVEPDLPLEPLGHSPRSAKRTTIVMAGKDKGDAEKPRGRTSKEPKRRTTSSSAQSDDAKTTPDSIDIKSRRQRYMMAAKSPMQLMAMGVSEQPISPATLHQMLTEDAHVQVVRRLQPARATLFSSETSVSEIVVAEMDVEYAQMLRHQLPQVQVERDQLLTYAAAPPSTGVAAGPEVAAAEPLLLPLGLQTTISFLVQSPAAEPLRDVTIHVIGTAGLFQAVTGGDGRAHVTLFGDTPQSVQSILVMPAEGYWNWRMERPALATGRDNVVTLRRLSDLFTGFPAQQTFGWGQRAMRLDKLSPTFRGAGVKVAVIDSGVDTRHPDLKNEVAAGKDLVDRTPTGWTVDTVRHGSHCSGIITAADNGKGIFGFATEAEIHICKIFPGGWQSDLIEALDYCIDNQIDVVNLSMGMPGYNNLVAQKINDARNLGVACVVAAGNTAGPVNFPGNIPTVLTVAAIGKVGTYPTDSGHAAEATPANSDGYFSARFTCLGPEIDVCAPGVAILSTVPGGYAAWDGTSQAAPHVTGLAALVLAHRDEFRNEFRYRDRRRVDRLFQVLKASCVPVDLGDRNRTGVGMPDAVRAFEPISADAMVDVGQQAMLDELIKKLIEAGLTPATGLAPQQFVPGQASPSSTDSTAASSGQERLITSVSGALAQLDHEMYSAGLTGYGPDPLA